MKRIISLLSVVLLTVIPAMAQRQVETLNFGWQFSRDASFKTATNVNVPHDFQIGQPWVAPSAGEKADNTDAAANIKSRLSARGFKEIGTGWYKKTITPDASKKGKRILMTGPIF